MSAKIQIDIKEINSSEVIYNFEISKSLNKYILTDEIRVDYGIDISKVPREILMVGPTTIIGPFAWLLNADLQINTVEEDFFHNIHTLRNKLDKFLPHANFEGQSAVEAQNINPIQIDKNASAVLFTGGVDSTAAYYLNSGKCGTLIKIKHADYSPHERKEVDKYIQKFADYHNVDQITIGTNMKDILNQDYINAKFGRQLRKFGRKKSSWWGRIQSTFSIPALCAPITYLKGIDTLHIGSDLPKKKEKDSLLQYISWSGVDIQVSREVERRQEKIRYLIPKIEERDFAFDLRHRYVCNRDIANINCEKCYQTFAGFLAEDFEPDKVGFDYHDSPYTILEQYIETYTDENSKMTTTSPACWNEIIDRLLENCGHKLTKDQIELFSYYKPREYKYDHYNLKSRVFPYIPEPIDYYLFNVYNSQF